MTISKKNIEEAYVWIWLPNEHSPTVAGKLEKRADKYVFVYAKSYIRSSTAIPFSAFELPLVESKIYKPRDNLHFVFRDSLPDAWGRRVLFQKYQQPEMNELEMLLLSSSDRIGSLDFQQTATDYQSKYESAASLNVLQEAASLIEQGQALPETLSIALLHGTSVGGARPKALIDDDHKKYIAKFSSSNDLYPIVQAEFAAMRLAKKMGIHVAPVKLCKIKRKYILLVERFDRTFHKSAWEKLFITSALTLLGLSETEGRYASYLELADVMKRYCKDPVSDLHELFRRMIFNILIGNTDDHAKNHAFFWDGTNYQLTPAYDICPYLRSGFQATQAMTVGHYGSYSTLNNALSAYTSFSLTQQEAAAIIDKQVSHIKKYWPIIAEEAELTPHQQKQLFEKAVLNPYCFYQDI
jgi:serine/threonine-protein kinase HipA